jgi:hypothetical protein
MAFTALPLRRSIPAGLGAFVTGYLISVVIAGSRLQAVMAITVTGEFVEQATLGRLFGSPPSPTVVGGWLFYNAQFIPTSIPTSDAINGLGRLTNRSLLLAIDGSLLLLYLVPLVLVLAAGYLTVRTGPTYGVRGETYGGASVALGYLPPLIIGAFLLRADVPTAPPVASPDGLQTIFIGLVYTLLVGAIGGKMAEIRSSTD